MPVEIQRQVNFTGGELDPKVQSRRDIKAYLSSSAALNDVLILPQGPIVRRYGFAFVDRIRCPLQQVDVSGATWTSPHSAFTTAITAADGNRFYTDEQTVSATTAVPFIVIEADFAGPTTFGLVDLIDFDVSSPQYPAETTPTTYPWSAIGTPTNLGGGQAGAPPPTVPQCVQVQTWDGVNNAWVNFGPAVDTGIYTRTRRVGLAPGQSVTTTKARLIVTPPPGSDSFGFGQNYFYIDAMLFLQEHGAPGNVRLWRFTRDTAAEQYMLVATDQNAEVYQRGERVASIRLPHVDGQIALTDKTQALDTMILFHQDVAPWRLTRQGNPTQWDSRAVAFQNVPLYDYLNTHTGGQNTVQEIRFVSYQNGDTFNISVEGETTTAITFNSNSATLIPALTSALEALPNIGNGGVSIVYSGTGEIYDITFIGQNADTDVGQIAPETLSSTAGGVFGAVLTQGKAGGEPIFSATRGYPRCGCFYQERLYMGGLKSLPQTIIASRQGFYFDLEDQGAAADVGINETIDTDEAIIINALFPGRHLQVFTSSAEFYFPSEPIVAPAAIKQTTRRGSQPGVPQFFMGEATMFVTAAPPDPKPGESVGRVGGAGICEYVYDIYQENYSAGFISTLASHIVSDIVDLGFRKARSTEEMDMALLVRSDGAGTLMAALREEQVTAFTPMTTQGQLLAAAGEENGYIYAAVMRFGVLCLERMDPNVFTDCAVQAGAGVNSVGGFPFPDGTTVTVLIDGADAGDFQVQGGAVQLPYAPETSVEAGLNFTPSGTTLPAVLQNDPRSGAAMRASVCEIAFKVENTSSLTAGLAGGKMWRVPLKRRPTALLDQGPGENAFTGWTRIQGVPGFAPDAQVQWVQDRPGPLTIKEIVLNVGT
jgi:hypothetical protein